MGHDDDLLLSPATINGHLKLTELDLIMIALNTLADMTDLTESDKIERYLTLTACLQLAVDRRSR